MSLPPDPPLPEALPAETVGGVDRDHVQRVMLHLQAERASQSMRGGLIGIAFVIVTQFEAATLALLAWFTLARLSSMLINRRICRSILATPAAELDTGRAFRGLHFGILISGLSWGSAAWMLPAPIGSDPAAHMLIITLVGISALMLSTSAPSPLGVALLLAGLWGTLLLKLLMQLDDPFSRFLLTGTGVYAGLSMLHGLHLHNRVRSGILAELHNERLLMLMTEARQREQAQSVALAQANQQLAEALNRMKELASHDELTGLLNRRAFLERVRTEIAAQRRHGELAAVILIDLDHFKAINDQLGHQCGDEVLRATALLLQQHLRGADILARWGGEEFLIFMPRTSVDDATLAAERLRHALRTLDCPNLPQGWTLSASFGVAALDNDLTLDTATARADQALYQAKAGGRDRVCRFDRDVPTLATDVHAPSD
jgi:diguanylate cyclase (GGDEF)-like protein